MTATKVDLAFGNQRKSWAPLLGLSAQEVFSLMLGCELRNAPIPLPHEGLDVTAMVGLAGSMCGLVMLRCTSKSTAVMASRMVGLDAPPSSPEALDAIGEVCNMIAGNFKNKISGMGDHCKLSVPTVITGADYCLRSPGEESKIELSMMIEGLPLVISLEVTG
ncbi:MAG: chemotaxis protein CheX [Candidatus Sulfotelmatobacter sp.]